MEHPWLVRVDFLLRYRYGATDPFCVCVFEFTERETY